MSASARELALDIARRTLRATRPLFVETETTAASVDPVWTGLRRNRVNAELLKAALTLGPKEADSLDWGPDFRAKVARAVLAGQKSNGCWHEIHPAYDQPSALSTAFMAEALLKYRQIERDAPKDVVSAIDEGLPRARDYILKNEERPGFFLKSEKYRADHLNVDVSCGAFLAEWAEHAKDGAAREAARRTVALVAREQFDDGAYPYTTADDGPPYPYPLNVPCIHYQGVTGYYLAKIHSVDPSSTAEESLRRAAAWLANVQRPDGTFDWRRSHMMFAYQLTGAYGFAAALFAYTSRWDASRARNAELALAVLDKNVPGLATRWEKSRMRRLPSDAAAAVRAGWRQEYSAAYNLQRVGHGLYRQLARQRWSETADARLFHLLRRTFRLTASTVEPSKNFPDLFMTAEAADCAAFVGRTSIALSIPASGARSA